MKVALQDKREFEADIVLKDERTDVAVIKIREKGTYPFARIGDSESLQVGDLVLFYHSNAEPSGVAGLAAPEPKVREPVQADRDIALGLGRAGLGGGQAGEDLVAFLETLACGGEIASGHLRVAEFLQADRDIALGFGRAEVGGG